MSADGDELDENAGKAFENLVKLMQQPGFQPEPAVMSELLLLLSEEASNEAWHTTAMLTLSTKGCAKACQNSQPSPWYQPIMDLLLLLARDKWPAVHSTLMLSEGWLNTLVPALTALAVHRAELDLDNSAAVLVLQALGRNSPQAALALASALAPMINGNNGQAAVIGRRHCCPACGRRPDGQG